MQGGGAIGTIEQSKKDRIYEEEARNEALDEINTFLGWSVEETQTRIAKHLFGEAVSCV